ncbi:GNAT family N-acetyltransferase [Paenibacillus campi]|uniref:GNAT family N-acetyltransferase n=1 Tax=Paenibacillus campi TaxID=3106031 RepID=UPI002B00168E|nr:GNAT family N-acetyltransferase [Paenibacillus sp. SGZ-1014]
MKIRPIEPRDNAAIERIIKQSLESFALNLPGTAYFDPQLSQLADYYNSSPRIAYWVAVNDEDIVVGGAGIGTFGKETEVCELQKLYIAPEAQGKGLARLLVQQSLDFAAQHYRYCYLETFDRLEVANALYLKFGFLQLERPLDGTEHNACDAWYIKELSMEQRTSAVNE